MRNTVIIAGVATKSPHSGWHERYRGRVLLIEKPSSETLVFFEAFHAEVGCRVQHARSLSEGLSALSDDKEGFDIILFTLNDLNEALQTVERIYAAIEERSLYRSRLIALGPDDAPASTVADLRDQQVDYLIRSSMKQVIITTKGIFWKLRTQKWPVTILSEHRLGEYVFHLCGATGSAQLPLGPQLAVLLHLMAQGLEWYSVAMLAQSLGVSKLTIKAYMKALRSVFDIVRLQLLVLTPGDEVFLMNRGVGGTRCGIRANVI